jgi:hypothetical protein
LVSLSQVASLYTSGLAFFHERLVPHLKRVRGELSGGVWDLADFVAYAADSDVDFMTHLVEAVSGRSAFGLRRASPTSSSPSGDASPSNPRRLLMRAIST